MSRQQALVSSYIVKKGQIEQFGYKITLQKRTNNSATETGFTSYVRTFKMYESLFSKFMYVEGLIVDGGGIIQRLGVQPGDILRFEIFKDASDTIEDKISKDFVIEQLGGQLRNEGQKSSKYTFRAISNIGFKNLTNVVKKSYRGKPSEIVKSISTEFLKPAPNELLANNFTSTFGSLVYNVNNKPPFAAIEDISKHCIAEDDDKKGNFFFYEDRNGIYFRPLADIVQSANAFIYTFTPEKNRSQTSASNDYFRIQEFTHHESTDQRKKLLSGTLKNKTLTFDFVRRTIEETTFDIRSEPDKTLLLGKNLLMDEEEMSTFIGDINSDQRETNEEPNLFIRCSGVAYDNTNEYLGAIHGLAKAQKGLLNQTAISVVLLGNPKIKPGDIIDIKINQASGEPKEDSDFVLSGKFLVGSCAHSITDVEKYITICDVFKDGYERSIEDYRKDINSHFIKQRA